MDFENKQLKNWFPWLAALSIFGLFLFQWYAAFTRAQAHWDDHLTAQKQAFDQEISTQHDLALQQASVVARLISLDPHIVDLIKAEADQAGQITEVFLQPADGQSVLLPKTQRALQEASQGYWSTLEKLGTQQLIFYGAEDGVVLFRLHHPERFGDRMGPIRPMVAEVFKTNREQIGLDVERSGSAYRAIIPVFDMPHFGVRAIGAVEIGFGLLPSQQAHLLTTKPVTPHNNNSLVRVSSVDKSDPRSIATRGQAVLLREDLAAEKLWPEVRLALNQKSSPILKQWLVESSTQLDLIKEWQEKHLLGDPLEMLLAPKVISHQQKHYLISSYQPDFFSVGNKNLSDIKTTALTDEPKLLVINWRDISENYNNFQIEKMTLSIKWLLAFLFTEFALWLIFVFQNRKIARLKVEQAAKLKTEHERLLQAEQRLNFALADSDSGFWEWDISSNTATFSANWRDVCGVPNELASSGDMGAWLDRIHPSDKRSSYDALIQHLKGETANFENEYRLRVADGSYRWIFSRGKVFERQADGKAVSMAGVYTDITESKKNGIIVARQQGAMQALNEIASLSVMDAEEQLSRALMIGSRFLGLNVGTISSIQGNHFQTRLKVKDERTIENPKSEALSNYFCEFTFRHQNIFSINNVSTSEYARHRAHSLYHQQSYIGVPIYLKDQIIGTLSFSSAVERLADYDNIDRDFLWLLTRWVSVTLERWEYQDQQKLFQSRLNKLCQQLSGFLFILQIDEEGHRSFPYASSGIYEFFGVFPEEVGECAEKIFTRIHPDDIDWLEQSLQTSKDNLLNWNASFRVINRTQGELWVQVVARPDRLKSGLIQWYGVLTNITETKRAEQQLRAINEISETIFEASNMLIISTDISGLIKTFNRGAENLLGYKATEVINRVSPVIFHLPEEIQHVTGSQNTAQAPAIDSMFNALIDNLSGAQGSEYECTYKRKNGALFSINLSISYLHDSSHRVNGYLFVGRDVTEIKRSERLKNELISTVSHALRTPLTAISGSLGILAAGAAGDLPETATKLLKIAQTNCQRLTHVANDLLDLESIASGVMEINLTPCALLPIVQNTLDSTIELNIEPLSHGNEKDLVDNTATKKSERTISLKVFTEENIVIFVDANRLQQILDNFLSNAKKFSPENSPIEIQVTTEFNRVRIAVVDQGIGVAEKFRSRLFEKFTQADDLDVRLRTGSGLGLAINKELAERMGAQVGYEPNEEKGSRFYIEFDYANTEEELNRLSERGKWTNRILLAEEDPEIAELLTIMLRTYHYRVDRVQTGLGALEQIALNNYQAVILNSDLPDRDGDQLVYAIKRDVSTKRVPIILLSNFHYEQGRKKVLDPFYKDVEWLPRPPGIDEMMNCLHRIINQPTKNKRI